MQLVPSSFWRNVCVCVVGEGGLSRRKGESGGNCILLGSSGRKELDMKICWQTLEPIEEKLSECWVVIDPDTCTHQPIWVG